MFSLYQGPGRRESVEYLDDDDDDEDDESGDKNSPPIQTRALLSKPVRNLSPTFVNHHNITFPNIVTRTNFRGPGAVKLLNILTTTMTQKMELMLELVTVLTDSSRQTNNPHR